MLADVGALKLRLARRPMAALARLIQLARLRSVATGPVPVTTQFDGRLRIPASSGRVNLSLGDHCRLGEGVFFETVGGRIELGPRARINAGCTLVSYASISIGEDTLIGEYVSIRDADHGIAVGAGPIRSQPHGARPIRIGRDVWIARGAAILKGVTIGDGAVIGANSVVNRDVPSMAIVAGAPARLIRMRGEVE